MRRMLGAVETGFFSVRLPHLEVLFFCSLGRADWHPRAWKKSEGATLMTGIAVSREIALLGGGSSRGDCWSRIQTEEGQKC